MVRIQALATSVSIATVVDVETDDQREWLLRRVEARRGFVNAEPMMREACWGRLLGLLEVGTAFDFWSRTAADCFSNSVEHKYRVGRAIRVFRRG
jgi:hypothetical protein